MRGTAGYMAPEQGLDAAAAGPPADVFSLGVILYECLSGVPPFVGMNVIDLLTKVDRCEHEPLLAAAPSVPEAIALVVERALEREPTARFADGRAMLEA